MLCQSFCLTFPNAQKAHEEERSPSSSCGWHQALPSRAKCPCRAQEQSRCLHSAGSRCSEGKPYTEQGHTMVHGNLCKAWLTISNCLPASSWQPTDQTTEEACHAVIKKVIYAVSSGFVLTLFFTVFTLRVAILWDSWCWQVLETKGKMVIFLFCVWWLDSSYRIVSSFG